MDIRKRLRAFTLIELLIVITIIGILAVALVPRITGGPAKARDAARKADIQQIATGLEFYADDNGGVYPGTAGTAECLTTGTTYSALGSYMNSVPADPQGVLTIGSCDTGYYYLPVDSGAGYILLANLENDDARDQGAGLYENDVSGLGSGSSISDLTECVDTTACADGTDVIYGVGR